MLNLTNDEKINAIFIYQNIRDFGSQAWSPEQEREDEIVATIGKALVAEGYVVRQGKRYDATLGTPWSKTDDRYAKLAVDYDVYPSGYIAGTPQSRRLYLIKR